MGFRGAVIGGFRKDDVLAYIEETARERSGLQRPRRMSVSEGWNCRPDALG